MTKHAPAFWLLSAGMLASASASAAIRYYDITGSTATSENACVPWVLNDNRDDCTYNRTAGGTITQWIGPVFSAGYYAPGAAPETFSNPARTPPIVAPAPILPLTNPDKTGIPVERGFISIDDNGTADPADDIIGGTIQFGAFERNVSISATARVNESASRVIHHIVPPANAGESNVDEATANGSGGADYVVGVVAGTPAFPTDITGTTTAAGGYSSGFPSGVASESTNGTTDTRFWADPAPLGIARFEGPTGGLAGLRTTATIWDYACLRAATTACTSFTETNWNTDQRARYDNLLLRLSTDGAGHITSASAYLVNESDQNAVITGDDTWQATTLSFTGTEDASPEAFDDRATVTGGVGSTVTVDVLANDAPGVDPVSVGIVDQPAFANATVQANAVHYTVTDAASRGHDSFTYRVTDGNGDFSDATVEILSPAVDDSISVEDFVSTNIEVLDNDRLDLLTLPVRIEITSPPSHGGASVLPASGSLTTVIRYTSNAGYSGTDSLSYRLVDAQGRASNEAVVTIQSSDSAPTANPDTFAAVEHTVPTTLNVLQNDVIPADLPGTLAVTVQPAHGTVTVVPASFFSPSALRYTSASGYVGPDTLTYSVTDSDGDSAEAAVSITVVDSPLVATTPPNPYNGDARTQVIYDVLANVRPLVDAPYTLTITSAPASGTARVVAGASSNGGPAIGFASDLHSSTPSGSPLTLRYKVRDADGDESNEGTINITVADTVPSANADASGALATQPVTVSVLNNDGGLNNKALRLTVVTQPSHGTVRVNAASSPLSLPTLTYTAASGYTGTDTVRYRVADADGDASEADLTMTVSGPLQANNDATSNNSRAPTAIDVLANDTVLKGPAKLEIVTQPSHGPPATLTTVSSTGGVRAAIAYASNANYAGTDTFSYRITDRDGNVSNEATVTVTIANVAPAAVNDAGGDSGLLGTGGQTYVIEHLQTAFNVLHNDTLGNGPATIDCVKATADADCVLQSGQLPAHGTAIVESADDSPTGAPRILYTGDAGYVGPESFAYVLRDGDDQTSSAVVTFQVVNVPTASDDGIVQPLRTNTNTAITVPVLANDGGLAAGPITVSIVRVIHGTTTVNPDNTVTFTPDRDFTGQFTSATEGGGFRYRITDSLNQSSEAAAYIDVLPPPSTKSDSGGSALDAELLGLLLAGIGIRRRRG